MSTILKSISALLASLTLSIAAFGQGAPKPSAVTGDVVSVSDTKIVVKTKDGEMDAVLGASTEFKRVPPENPTLKAAVAASRSDIGEGDKVLVTGILSEDKKSMPARAVYLMTKSDIARKQQKDVERWGTRGISGRVASVNTAANQVTIEVRGLMSTTNVVVSAKPEAEFKRYRPNSVRYDEALESSISEIKPGDMFRAVGDRGTDGATFAAEEIVTGAFQTIAGTIKSVDAEKNEILLTDARTKKDVTVSLGSFSMLKKFPEEMMQRMMPGGGGQGGPGGGIRPAGGQPGATPAGPPAGGQPGAGQPNGGPGGGMRMGGPRGGIDDMFERLPAIAVADLKPGDVVAVSSSKTADETKVSAIKVLAGVGPFITAAQLQAASQGGRGSAGQAGFSIPGLDGFDFGGN